jgi:Ca2+-binding RTX toxin-like protein
MIGASIAGRGPAARVTMLAALALLLVPGSALAGKVTIESDGVPRYSEAAGGEDNAVVIGETAGPNAGLKTVIIKDKVPVEFGDGCSRLSEFSASCNVPVGMSFVRTNLGADADSLDPSSINVPVTTAFSFEGGVSGDRAFGTAHRDVLQGMDGNDELHGGAGDDVLEGGDHADQLLGDGGGDELLGGEGDDELRGSAGGDSLVGGPGRDTFSGGSDNDTLNADDGAGGDIVNCGGTPGTDTDKAIANLGDAVSNCEIVTIV